MSKELESLVKEFYFNLNLKTDQTTRQAKELKSLQRAIKKVSEAEWESLSDEEKKDVSAITTDTTSWWYTEEA